MKNLFIINPVSGGRKHKYTETESLIQSVMQDSDKPYEIYITTTTMDACEKVKAEADLSDELRVYACGGDGTLNECINGAVGRTNVSITNFPCGTGNDFIKTFGAEKQFKELSALVNGVVRPIDIIDCGGRYGINICSVGIDARIGADVHKYSGIPLIGGSAGYVTSLIVNLVRGVNSNFNVKTKNGSISGDFALVCACNGRFYGGGFNPVPDAMPDDGLIDFLVVSKLTRLKFIGMVGKYAKGRFRELGDIVTHVRGTEMEIESDDAFVVNVDGEVIYTKKVHFQIIPKGVNFIFPANMEFFESNYKKNIAIGR